MFRTNSFDRNCVTCPTALRVWTQFWLNFEMSCCSRTALMAVNAQNEPYMYWTNVGFFGRSFVVLVLFLRIIVKDSCQVCMSLSHCKGYQSLAFFEIFVAIFKDVNGVLWNLCCTFFVSCPKTRKKQKVTVYHSRHLLCNDSTARRQAPVAMFPLRVPPGLSPNCSRQVAPRPSVQIELCQ